MSKWGYIFFHIKGEENEIASAFETLCESDKDAWKKEAVLSENEWVITGNQKEPADLDCIAADIPALMIKGAVIDTYNGRLIAFYSKSGGSGIITDKTVPCVSRSFADIDDYTWWNEEKEIYEENKSGGLSLVRFNGGEDSFVIPETVNGRPVTEIKGKAFNGNELIRYISVHDGIKKIGAAFSGCSRLTLICKKGSAAEKYCKRKNFPFLYDTELNVNAIKQMIFDCKRDANGIEITNIKLETDKLDIPETIDSVTVYRIGGFGGSVKIRTAVIPEGVREIADNAFSGCVNLESAVIPESVVSIGASAFTDCKKLADVNIPSNVREIGSEAFSGCESIKSVALPESIEAIGSDAFCGCVSLSDVVFPARKIDIGLNAFEDTPFIDRLIRDGSGFAVIGGLLYKYRGNGDHAVIPDGVTEIGNNAFWGCTSIKSVTIPESVKKIGRFAFNGCSMLSDVKIHKGVSEIARFAFCGCRSLRKIVIPEGVSVIDEGAFSECVSLEDVTLPKSLKKLGAIVFDECAALSSLKIPENVEAVSLYDFTGCENIKDLYVSEGVKIKINEFEDIYSQTGYAPFMLDIEHFFIPGIKFRKLSPDIKLVFCIYFLTTADMYSDDERKMYISYIKRNKKIIFEAISETEILTALSGFLSLDIASISDIDGYIGFSRENEKTEILALLMEHKNKRFTAAEIERETELRLKREFSTDPFSVKELKKKWRFASLSDGTVILTSYKGTETEIFVPSKIGNSHVSALGDDIFNPWADKTANHETRRQIVSITVPEGITVIGDRAFSGCSSLENISLPGSLRTLGEKAFFRCDSIRSIVLPKSLECISDSTFYQCGSLAEINIPESVQYIGNSAFYECTGLSSVNIPDSVNSIGDFSFAECCNLENIIFGNGLSEIGSSAFTGCTCLTDITFPDSTEKIGDSAFSKCARLKRVRLPYGLKVIGKNTFNGCDNLKKPYIPDSVSVIDSMAI